MTTWPDGWRETVLRASRIPASQFALDVLSAWRRSTPLIPQTYNPLGMPSKGSRHPPYLGTAYALFPGITAFATAFQRFVTSSSGEGVLRILVAADSPSEAYRAIHALGWPATKTETDYPSAVLDMVEQSYRDSLASTQPAQRRTTGIAQAPPDVHAAVKQQAAVLHHAASHFTDTRKAIGFIVKGLG